METGAEHPGTGRLTPSGEPLRLVGIDLGTTNSAVAWVEVSSPSFRIRPQSFQIPQLVGAAEMGVRRTLPSFLYFPVENDLDRGAAVSTGDAGREPVAGVWARDQGALVPTRLIASAKSWLSNPSVDRRATLLPWGVDAAVTLSPVDASARLLRHIRDAWNEVYAADDEQLQLQRQAIVLTVPASFDEEARELTVDAAREVGFEHLTLLEEPLAALYAWIASHPKELSSRLIDGQLLLVCDVGGGTTDFSLIRATTDADGVHFERTAIGDHLLLGGDNVDVALTALVERKLAQSNPGGPRLVLKQRHALRRLCSAAKERLLTEGGPDRDVLTILGSGRGVVGGAVTAELTRDEVLGVLNEFLPIAARGERPERHARSGLRELGLPYETDPAVTRHLAAFLARARRMAGSGPMDPGDGELVRPDAVLFNGGFFTPSMARERILEALQSWFGERPAVLSNETPDAAVAVGAAFYAAVRRDPAIAKRLLIRAGAAHSYYVGVGTGEDAGGVSAVCVMPRGTQEGTRFVLEHEFTVIANQPAAFTLFSAVERADPLGALLTVTDDPQVHRHASLHTALRYGRRSQRVPLVVDLTAAFTEVGTLELWCESRTTAHRWRLQFNLRTTERDEEDEGETPDTEAAGDQALVSEEAVGAAERLLREAFGPGTAAPDALVGELENALGHTKHAWPLAVIRRLADVLLQVAEGRRASARHEARWLNLAGFCLRPGFGASLDAWRVGEMRKVYASGPAHSKDTQVQVEWLILWQRVSAGFTPGQQQELARRLVGLLGLGARKSLRLNSQMTREAWRLLASLERLDGAPRARFGDELIARVRREPNNAALAWAIGRIGARTPLYGPLNAVVPATVAEPWIEALLALKTLSLDAMGAVAQMAARTDDPARDLTDAARAAALARLAAAGASDEMLRAIREAMPVNPIEREQIFGEALPEGLHLEHPERGSTARRRL